MRINYFHLWGFLFSLAFLSIGIFFILEMATYRYYFMALSVISLIFLVIFVCKLISCKVEVLKDSSTGYKVVNYYVKKNLVYADLLTKKGDLSYRLFFADGKLEKTLNYGENGKITIEQSYYYNGNVKQRIEFFADKNSKTTEFPEMF